MCMNGTEYRISVNVTAVKQVKNYIYNLIVFVGQTWLNIAQNRKIRTEKGEIFAQQCKTELPIMYKKIYYSEILYLLEVVQIKIIIQKEINCQNSPSTFSNSFYSKSISAQNNGLSQFVPQCVLTGV